MNNQELERLDIWLRQELKEKYDLFDNKAEIDNTLTYQENKNILQDKIDIFLTKEVSKADYQEAIREEAIYATEQRTNIKELLKTFITPKIIGICADANEGKSNLIYYLIRELQRDYNFKLYSYGLKINLSEQKIYSIEELEKIRNSMIFIDEFYNLFDLDNRKMRRLIEQTIRLLYHNNNVILLCGLPDNFKKFISSKLNIIIYKKCTIASFINGSTIKEVAIKYKGVELGSTILNIDIGETLIYDGKHYNKLDIPYLPVYDTKKKNCAIISDKTCPEKDSKNVENIKK